MQRRLLVIDVSVQPVHIFKAHFTHDEGTTSYVETSVTKYQTKPLNIQQEQRSCHQRCCLCHSLRLPNSSLPLHMNFS